MDNNQEKEENRLSQTAHARRSQFATPHKNLLLFNDSKSHSKQPNPVRCEPTTGEFFVSTSSHETLVWKEVASSSSSSSSQEQQNENNNTKLEIVARSPSFSPSLATGDQLCPRLEGGYVAALLEIITTKQHYIILLGNGERGSLSFWAADRSSDLSKWAELGRLDVFAKSPPPSHHANVPKESVYLTCAKASPDFKKLAVCGGGRTTVEVFSLACLTDEKCLSSQTEMNKALNSTAHLLSLSCVIPAWHPEKETLGISRTFFSLGFCNYYSSNSKLVVGGEFKAPETLLVFSLETGLLEEVVPCKYPTSAKSEKHFGMNMWDLRASTSERRRNLGTDFVICCCQSGNVWRHDIRSPTTTRRLEVALKREEDEKRRKERSKTKEEIEQEQAEEERKRKEEHEARLASLPASHLNKFK